MNFNSILLNIMALLLSVYDTDLREDGLAVIELALHISMGKKWQKN